MRRFEKQENGFVKYRLAITAPMDGWPGRADQYVRPSETEEFSVGKTARFANQQQYDEYIENALRTGFVEIA